MFVLCPHCHFLVGLDPRTGVPPARCPRCDRPLADAREASAADGVQDGKPMHAPPPETAIDDATRAQPASPERVTSDASPSPPENAQAAAPPVPVSPQDQASAPPRLDADAMIAAMAAKTSRRAGTGRKKVESARSAPAAESTPPMQSAEPSAAAVTPPRGPRGKRKSESTSAQQDIPLAKAPADPAPSPQRAASPWWRSLLQSWRARAAATGTRKDAKAAAPATPVFDPLAASVRHRARNRRAAADAATATSASEAPAAPTATNAEPPATSPAVASGPSRGNDSVPPPAPHASTPAEAPAAPSIAADTPRIEPAPLAPSPMQVETPVVPAAAAETPTQVPAAQPAPTTETAFVERRRNPDVPIPPGTIPPHPLRRRTDAPSFARPHAASPSRRQGWRWPAAVVALSLLLVLQLLLAQRDTLAADARWRPTVSALCTLLRCRLPPWREPGAFTMLSRDVRAHPSAPGALLINASFRNDARWPQPWPRVLLTLSNVDGRIVGARAFAAGEYLGADTAATQHELAPGQTAAITMAVVEPAPDIVAFSFDFR